MSFPTPTTAVSVSELSATQLDTVKKGLKIYGSEMFSSIKTAGNHIINISEFADGFVYFIDNDNIINKTDTMTDIANNTFNVVLKDCDYVGSNQMAKIQISGTNAIVSRYNYFRDFTGNLELRFGETGTGNGQFNDPRDVFVKNGRFYVVERANNRIQIFDLAGNYISQFGTLGTGDGQFTNPTSVFVTDSNIYVTDSDNDRVQIFDLTGVFVSKFGSNGTGNGQFNTPFGIFVTDTNIYVTDFNNSRVQIFDLAGNYISQFGSNGSGDGQFIGSAGIHVTDTNIYVTDDANSRVQVFDLAGVFVSKFGTSGSASGQFNRPLGIFVTDTNIYVSERNNSRVQVFDMAGNSVKLMPTYQESPNYPYGLHVDNDNIFIALSLLDYVLKIK